MLNSLLRRGGVFPSSLELTIISPLSSPKFAAGMEQELEAPDCNPGSKSNPNQELRAAGGGGSLGLRNVSCRFHLELSRQSAGRAVT